MDGEERVRILGMVKEGKISPEEGLKLLEALEAGTEAEPVVSSERAKWLRIRVTDLKTNRPIVSVNLPIGIVDWALRAGSRLASLGGLDLSNSGVNLEELRASINHGLKGKIVDVVDEDDQEHVEIIVE